MTKSASTLWMSADRSQALSGMVDDQLASDRLLIVLLGYAVRRVDFLVANTEGPAADEASIDEGMATFAPSPASASTRCGRA